MGVGGPDWDIGRLSKLIAYRDQHNGSYGAAGQRRRRHLATARHRYGRAVDERDRRPQQHEPGHLPAVDGPSSQM